MRATFFTRYFFKKVPSKIFGRVQNFEGNPLSINLTKCSNTLKQFVGNLATNCLRVFDHFVGLALKELTHKISRLHTPKRSTRPELSYKKGVLESFAKCKGKLLCRSFFLMTSLKKLEHRCFLLYFAKIFKSNFITEQPRATVSD